MRWSAWRARSSASSSPTRSFSSWSRKMAARRRIRFILPQLLAALVLFALLDGRYASIENLALWSSIAHAALVLVAIVLWFSLINRRMREGEQPVLLELEVGSLMLIAAF